jgi:hypothetical protein
VCAQLLEGGCNLVPEEGNCELEQQELSCKLEQWTVRAWDLEGNCGEEHPRVHSSIGVCWRSREFWLKWVELQWKKVLDEQ